MLEPDALRERLRVEFGVRVMSVSQTVGGHDVEAVVLRAALTDGTSVAVKLSRGGTPAGLHAAQLLAGQGVVGVPAPLLARSGMPFSTTGGLRLSVAPWLPGRSGASAPMSAEQWRSFGTLLARVHAARVPPGVHPHLPAEAFDTSIATRMRSLHERIRHAEARTDDPLTHSLVGHWLGTADVLHVIAEQFESLGGQLRPRPVTAVLCHGDAHTGNVLVDEDGSVWLLDWDSAVLAPRERDLMFVFGGGVLADTPVTAEEESWFLHGYGPTQVDRARLAYYQGSLALVDAVGWAEQVLNATVPQHERAYSLEVFCGLLSTTGIVDRAVASLRQLSVAT